MSGKKQGIPPKPEIELTTVSVGKEVAMPHYQVFLLDDDYTPMNFVVEVLERYFSMEHQVANEVMLEVHTTGKGLCGNFTREIAETKVVQVNEYARRNQYPLLCTMEKKGN